MTLKQEYYSHLDTGISVLYFFRTSVKDLLALEKNSDRPIEERGGDALKVGVHQVPDGAVFGPSPRRVGLNRRANRLLDNIHQPRDGRGPWKTFWRCRAAASSHGPLIE
uniref:Uncharacterized protein n=1 Tax=Candidatus Kentrum sp. FW TaxID=2126338 RepID=A0A450U208_9GAMM|nr:MAG: hypothetical protein BECKFW1821C_GA0114237_110816 [Candidatus Kentron sp. FW]